MSRATVDVADKKLELKALQKKEVELLAALAAINESFAQLSIPINTNNARTGYNHPTELQNVGMNTGPTTVQTAPPTSKRAWNKTSEESFDAQKYKAYGIRMGNKLSFRGEDKAREYFDTLDDDHDGFIDYDEARAVFAFRHTYGMIEGTSHHSKEAWKTYMKNEGYSLMSTENKLSREDYVKYRVKADHQQPLLYELSVLGLGFVPKYLKHWHSINKIIVEVEKYREFCKSLSAADVKKLAGVVTIEEMMYIINNCNLNLTKPELLLLMLWRKQKANMLINLTRVYAKRNLSQKEYNFEIEKNRKMKASVGRVTSSIGVVNAEDATSRPTTAGDASRPGTGDTTDGNQANSRGRKKNAGLPEVVPGSTNEYKLIIGSRAESNNVTPQDIDHVPVNQFKAWLLAVPEFLDLKTWYRQILQWKYSFYRWSRSVTDQCRFLFDFAGHLNDRLVFREFLPINKMSRYFQEVATMKLSVQVGGIGNNSHLKKGYAHQTGSVGGDEPDGDEEDVEGDGNVGGDEDAHHNGLTLNWKLMKVENPEAIMTKLNIPTSCGSILFIDLLLKDRIPVIKQQDTCDTIKKYLMQQVERELKQNVNFTLLTCLAMKNEYDDSPVIRIIIAYKKMVSIDKFLEHQLLPYRLSDLVTMFVGDFKSNLDLHEYFHNKVNSLEEIFHCTMICTIGYRKNLLSAIMERLILAMSSGMTEAQADFLKQQNQAKIATSSPSDDEPIPSATSSNTVAITTASQSETNMSQKKKTSNPSLMQSKKGLNALSTMEGLDDDDTSAMRQYRWMTVYPYYSLIGSTFKQVYDLMYSWKTSVFRWQFRSLSDLVMRLPYFWGTDQVNPILTKEQKHLLFKPGFVRDLYLEMVKNFKEEFGTLFEDLKTFLERRKKEEDHRRYLELISFEKKKEEEESFKAMESKKNSTLERMKRIGLEGEELDAMLTNEEFEKNPLLFINSQETDNRLGDITSLRFLETLSESIVGVHSVEILSGRNKLTTQVHGLDFIQFIPKLGSMNEVFLKNSFSKKNQSK